MPWPLFFRDACALVDPQPHWFNERMIRSTALARAHGLGLEVTLVDVPGLSRYSMPGSDVLAPLLEGLDVTVHLPEGGCLRPDVPVDPRRIVEAAKRFEQIVPVKGYCLHPDVTCELEPFAELVTDSTYVAIEVLGAQVERFATLEAMTSMLDAHRWLDMVLDTAHVAEQYGPAMDGQKRFVERLGSRIKEVHLSSAGNYYDPEVMPKGFGTGHSLTSLNPAWGRQILPVLDAIEGANVVIEGVVPQGPLGEALLTEEMLLLSSFGVGGRRVLDA